MQRPVSNPEQPHVNRFGALNAQLVPRGDHGVADRSDLAIHVDGDDCSVTIGLGLLLDVAVLDFVAEASDLLGRAARRHCRVLLLLVSSGTYRRPPSDPMRLLEPAVQVIDIEPPAAGGDACSKSSNDGRDRGGERRHSFCCAPHDRLRRR